MTVSWHRISHLVVRTGSVVRSTWFLSFVPVRGTRTQNFSAPFTGSWEAAATLLHWEKLCIISFPTSVQTYEKWGGWDSPLCLFFIRKTPKPSQSLYMCKHISWKSMCTLAGSDWVGLTCVSRKCTISRKQNIYMILLISKQHWRL